MQALVGLIEEILKLKNLNHVFLQQVLGFFEVLIAENMEQNLTDIFSNKRHVAAFVFKNHKHWSDIFMESIDYFIKFLQREKVKNGWELKTSDGLQWSQLVIRVVKLTGEHVS